MRQYPSYLHLAQLMDERTQNENSKYQQLAALAQLSAQDAGADSSNT